MFISEAQVSADDRRIIESAMSLWSTLLQEQGAQEASPDPKSMLDSKFILQGLVNCSDGPVRSAFHATFRKISKSQASLRAPLIEILAE